MRPMLDALMPDALPVAGGPAYMGQTASRTDASLGVAAPGQNNYPCIYLASPLEPGPEPGPCGVCPPLRSRRTNAGSRASDPAGRVCSPHGGEPGRCMAGGLDPDPRTSPITHHPSPITHHPSPITHLATPPTCFRGAGAPVRPSRDHYL